jgi:hypothetical protein
MVYGSYAHNDTFKLMLLQDTQESNLSLGWKFSDFIQEERTAIC